MDDNQIEQSLRDVLLAEPPLGIDPDRVADLAARRQRHRRVAVSAGVATLAVIGLASGALAYTSGSSPGVVQAGSSPTQAAEPADHQQDLKHQMQMNAQHLRYLLPGLMPGAKDFTVTYEQYHGTGDASMTAVVTFTDSAGPGTFNVSISSPEFSKDARIPLAEMCDPAAPPVITTDGDPLKCAKELQPDGSTVVLEEGGLATGASPQHRVTVSGENATHYRLDGGTVGVINDRYLPGQEELRSRNPLTEQQLVKLSTDPGLLMHDPVA